jgi:acetate kinase
VNRLGSSDGSGLTLVLNAGSSTLKASVLGPALGPALGALPVLAANPPDPVAACTVSLGDDATRGAAIDEAVAAALDRLRADGVPPDTVGLAVHRVVHGGERYREPAIVDDGMLTAIDAAAELAPLHNMVAAAVIRSSRTRLPRARHVAVFDTAFHAGLPEAAWRYPLPTAWEAWGIRRYGFHGLSVAWAVVRASALLGRPVADLGLVVAHLGNGCSVTAVDGGRSVATSMGMTPLEGLMMGTRAGSLDPGIILAVLRAGRRSPAELSEDLDHASGLLGVSGRTGAMDELEASAQAGDERAALAVEMFVVRAAAGIAAAATSLRRLDAVVFTGGIGAHAGSVRARIVERLSVLGAAPIAPDELGADRVLPPTGRSPVMLRIGSREDLVAARAALELTS